jgi:hypothetical protein
MSSICKKIFITLIGFYVSQSSLAASDAEIVAQKLEAFKAAQVTLNANELLTLSSTSLSYSHSDGRVEDQATFVANATSGKSRFTSLEYRNPTVKLTGNIAVVRFNWIGEQEAISTGVKTSTNLHILMVWLRQGDDWKLLARSATKL